MCEIISVQISVQDGFERDSVKVARGWFHRPIAATSYRTVDDTLRALIENVVEYAVVKVGDTCCTPFRVYLDNLHRYNVYVVGECEVEYLPRGHKANSEIVVVRYFVFSRTLQNPIDVVNFKTCVIFTLSNITAALSEALHHYSSRGVEISSIETGPTPQVITQDTSLHCSGDYHTVRDFRHTVCIEFMYAVNDARVHSVLTELRKLSGHVRVLGSYPTSRITSEPGQAAQPQTLTLPATAPTTLSSNIDSLPMSVPAAPLRICVVGFGNFGQFIARTFVRQGHAICCVDVCDRTTEARALGCEFHLLSEILTLQQYDLDVVLLAVSILSFEEVLAGLPQELLQGKLVVDVLSVKIHAKEAMLRYLPASADILCTHPMFGPVSGKNGWQGLPFVFDRVRIVDTLRCDAFLELWVSEGCTMIDMPCETHDQHAARTQFLTHLTGRALGELGLGATPIDTRGFESLRSLVHSTCSDSFDLFLGLYRCNPYALEQLNRFRDAVDLVGRTLDSD